MVPLIEQARENLGVAALETLTLADTGYGAGADLQAAREKQLPVLVPPAEGKPAHHNPYAGLHFYYDPQARTVTCPQNRQLDYEGHTDKAGQRVERHRCHCLDCPVRAQCTRDPKGWQIEIWPHTQVAQAMRAELQTPLGQAVYKRRSQLIERRFGQIKQHDGFRRWTVWGLEAVRTQWAMLCATLNLRILYKRWRPGSPAGPKATAAKTVRAEKPGIFLAPVFFQVRQMRDAARRAIERGCRCIPNWAA